MLEHGGVRETRRVHALGRGELSALDVLADRARDAVDPRDVRAHVAQVVDAMEVDQCLGRLVCGPSIW